MVTFSDNTGIWIISIHAPTKGATRDNASFEGATHNFNPRSHEGSDVMLCLMEQRLEISIHAPTKGATFFRCTRGIYKQVFQSTLPRRERLSGYNCINNLCRFQSTLPRRERRYCTSLRINNANHFNPRSHEGSDLVYLSVLCFYIIFQSTLPRRERHAFY